MEEESREEEKEEGEEEEGEQEEEGRKGEGGKLLFTEVEGITAIEKSPFYNSHIIT